MTFVTSELRIRSRAAGETTWKRPEIERGLEADQSYYFEPEKLRIVTEARARKAKDIAEIPNPDLAIEIDISPSQVDRPGIYACSQGCGGLAVRRRVGRRSSDSGPTARTPPRTRAGSCLSGPRRFAGGSKKKIPATSWPGKIDYEHGHGRAGTRA